MRSVISAVMLLVAASAAMAAQAPKTPKEPAAAAKAAKKAELTRIDAPGKDWALSMDLSGLIAERPQMNQDGSVVGQFERRIFLLTDAVSLS